MSKFGEWVSVNDRLPPIKENYPGSGTGHSKPVLVYMPGKPKGDDYDVQRCYRGGRGDTTSIHWDWGEPVTHWMPLPIIPKK